MRYTFALLAALAVTFIASPAFAQGEPMIEITDLYAFDASKGKQDAVDKFTWPNHQSIGALVRYRTSGYDRRKTVQLFFVAYDRRDDVLYKFDTERTLHAGEHEFVIPERWPVGNIFLEDRIRLSVEAKLVGANRETEELEVIIDGPAMPEIVFTDLRMVDPDNGAMITALRPGDKFNLVGAVSVQGNTSYLLPRLTVWGLMDQDDLDVDVFEPKPFSDVYWGWAHLPQHNGKWSFNIRGEMPRRFKEGMVESRPWTFSISVAFTELAIETEELRGTVLASGSGDLVSDDLDERLIWIERNWHWDLEEMQ